MPTNEEQKNEIKNTAGQPPTDGNTDKALRLTLNLWLKRKGRVFLWSLLLFIILGVIVVLTNVFAIYKFQQASSTLNKSNEVTMEKTGITIDSVDIDAYQLAEKIVKLKKRTETAPTTARNPFQFDAYVRLDGKTVTGTPKTNTVKP